jgi:hemolysin III
MSVEALSSPTTKPRFRGVSHKFAFVGSLFLTALLVAWSPNTNAKIATAIFGGTVALLLGTSALYHRIDWKPVPRQRMRRLDHAAIFVLIAGGYTPLLALVPAASGSRASLFAMWAGAGVGVVKSLLWPNAPKWVTAALCVGLGWTGIGAVVARAAIIGPVGVCFIVAAGVIFSAGAVVYARKRPDPWPLVFGYHEIFHALVIVATLCLYAHTALIVRATS